MHAVPHVGYVHICRVHICRVHTLFLFLPFRNHPFKSLTSTWINLCHNSQFNYWISIVSQILSLLLCHTFFSFKFVPTWEIFHCISVYIYLRFFLKKAQKIVYGKSQSHHFTHSLILVNLSKLFCIYLKSNDKQSFGVLTSKLFIIFPLWS